MSTQTLVSERLEVSPAALAAFCQRWHIVKLEAFGSIVRPDFRAESDVDFLVSFAPGGSPEGFDWFRIQEELTQLVGRKVDLLDRRIVEQSRNLYRRHHILNEATPVYGS
jgi:predicted nucleotidyltransferase